MSRRHSQKISIPLPCNDHVEKFSEKKATKTGAISGDNDSNLMQVEEHQRRGGKEEKLSIQFHLPTMRVNLVCFNN